MRNPLRNEATAFRFVLGTIAYLTPIVLASWIATWLGVIVFVVLTAAAVWLLRGGAKTPPAPQHIQRAAVEDTRRILVVANETVGGAELRDTLRSKAEGVAEDVLVICPALNSQLRTWLSDEDGARDAAQDRLRRSLAQLEASGVSARGDIGDGDPLQALEDALRTFPADEIVISTHPVGRSTGSSTESSMRPACASTCRSRTSSRHLAIRRAQPCTTGSARSPWFCEGLLAGDRRHVCRDGVDLGCRELALERRHRCLAVRDPRDDERRRRAWPHRDWGRRCPTSRHPSACGSSRNPLRRRPLCLQRRLPSPAAGFPVDGARRGLRLGRIRVADAGDRGNVARHVLRVLALDDVLRHAGRARRWVLDGYAIWPRTTCSIVDSPRPARRDCRNA